MKNICSRPDCDKDLYDADVNPIAVATKAMLVNGVQVEPTSVVLTFHRECLRTFAEANLRYVREEEDGAGHEHEPIDDEQALYGDEN